MNSNVPRQSCVVVQYWCDMLAVLMQSDCPQLLVSETSKVFIAVHVVSFSDWMLFTVTEADSDCHGTMQYTRDWYHV